MLSFSDSRQGTARLSVRMQQEAERNYSRGLLYHNIAEMQKSGPISLLLDLPTYRMLI